MPHCQNCDAYVTAAYARVFGDNTNEVHACRNCATAQEMYNDAGAGYDPDRRRLYLSRGEADV